MLALEPEQCLAHRLAADGITLRKLLLTHIITGRQTARQNIRAEALVDIIAQKHHISSHPPTIWQPVKYHVK
jgi:hypothetical protein